MQAEQEFGGGNLQKFNFSGYSLVFVLGAAAFLVMLAAGITGPARTAAKAVPVATLLVLVLRDMGGFVRFCLAGALLGSVAGDILLDLPYDALFVFGLAAFLAGHLFYTLLFFRYARLPGGFETAVTAAMVIFAAAMIWLFSGIEPALFKPVVLYIVVIVAMSIGALLVPAPDRLLFYGAFIFIASDVVLAVNKFLITIPAGRIINITLYFTAQYIIIAAARAIWKPSRRISMRSNK